MVSNETEYHPEGSRIYVGEIHYPYTNAPTTVLMPSYYKTIYTGGDYTNQMKLGTILTETNTLKDLAKGELVLLVPGYKASDFELYSSPTKQLNLKVKEKKIRGEKVASQILTFELNQTYPATVEEFKVSKGVLRIKVSYFLGDKISIRTSATE